jgi:hypothetical protein
LGYEKGTKAYRAYDPVNKKVHVTRDVVFDEQAQWDWGAEAVLEPKSTVSSEPFTIQWETEMWIPSEYADAGNSGEGGALELVTHKLVMVVVRRSSHHYPIKVSVQLRVGIR